MAMTRDYAWNLPHATVSFTVSAATDKGHVRKINEDSFVAAPPLFMVADGMGGHAFGDRASQETSRVLESLLVGNKPVTSVEVIEAVRQANIAVQEISADDFAGTTLSGVAFVQNDGSDQCHWMAFNIGDSRVYSWDGSTVTQVSVDHSAVQEMVDGGLITALEAAVHPDRNVITKAIGIDADIEADVWLLPVGGTQRFVICSDGLTKELDDATIAAVLSASSGDESAADRLVKAALSAGGGDNVTVVVVESTVLFTSDDTSSELSDVEALPPHLEETLPRR